MLTALMVSSAIAGETTIYVDDATAAADLMELLREELPPQAFARTATIADLRARLAEPLRLIIVDRGGIVMLDRPLEGGRDAAVRVAALLIVEAREAWRPPATIAAIETKAAVTTTVAEARAWRAGGTAGIGIGTWSLDPQLLFAFSAYFAISDFEIGIAGSLAGLGCVCSIRTTSLRGEPTAFAILAAGRWSFWRPLPALESSIWLALGYQRERLEARVIGFRSGSDGPLETLTFDDFIGRAGLGASALLFDLLRLRLDLGVQAQRSAGTSLPNVPEYENAEGREIGRANIELVGTLSVGVEI